MKILFCLLALIVSACFLGGGPYQPVPRAADEGSKLITKVWETVNPEKWRKSPWYRFGIDMTTPGSVIESGEYACILDVPDINTPRENNYYVCKTGWRPSQRRGQ